MIKEVDAFSDGIALIHLNFNCLVQILFFKTIFDSILIQQASFIAPFFNVLVLK